MRSLIHLYYSLLLLLVTFTAKAQVSFTILPSAAEIFRNDVLQVEYAIRNTNAIADFMPPAFKGWAIRSGPMVSEEQSNINGQTSRKTSYIYSLAPQHAGMLTLPGTTVNADGKKLSCAPVRIKILDKDNPSPLHTPPPSSAQLQSLFGEKELDNTFSQAPVLRRKDSPAEMIRNNTRVRVIPSKTTCYAGEPVLVTYQLLTALPSNPIPEKPPYFNGCSVTEIPFDQEFTTEKIGGKTFRVVTVRKVQLIPLQPGDLSLGELSVLNQVTFRLEEEQYRSQAYKLSIKNAPASIKVLPLPGKAPAGFDGAIGHFTITAAVKSSNLPAQENNKLVITISGKGNLTQLITPPAVEWPAATEHYDATSNDDINNTVVPFEGARSFEIPFLGTKEGKVVIPPVHFSFFDPGRQQYETLSTNAIPLQFTKATGNHFRDDPAFSEDRTTRQYIWIVPALALLVTGILYINGRREKRKKTMPPSPAAAPVITKTDLSTAAALLEHIDDHHLYFNKCKALLSQALAEHTGQPTGTSVPALLAALAMNHQPDTMELLNRCRQLYTDCDLALYAPAGHETEKKKILEELREVLLLLG